jgi:hypothetical protein
MKLKNKYSKQNTYIYIYIYSNQKFEDQIWYNQQIIWYFLFFHKFRKMFSVQIFQENTFLKTKPNFSLTRKCFCWPIFLMANKYKKVWKIIFYKSFFEKQTWPNMKLRLCIIYNKDIARKEMLKWYELWWGYDQGRWTLKLLFSFSLTWRLSWEHDSWV